MAPPVEEVWPGGTAGGPARGAKTSTEGFSIANGTGRASQGSPGSWVQCGPLELAAHCHRDQTRHRSTVPSWPRLEDSGRDEVDLAETGATGPGAEPGPGPLLEDRALAGAKKNAARQRAWIFFQDETGFTQQPSICRTWAPRGETPILRPRGNHWTKTSVAAALGFRWDGRKTRLLARTKPDSFNTESLIAFLKDLKRFVQGAKVILIWDRLPAHRSKLMKRFLYQQREWLQIEWLPSYAPDLNPTEGVWNNIKRRELGNFCADHIDEATNAFRSGLRRVAHTVRLPLAFLRHADLSF